MFIAGVFCTVLGVLFTIPGMISVYLIKKHFIEFYNEYKCYIWTSTIGLPLPVLLRGIYDLLDYDKVDNHVYLSVIIVFILKLSIHIFQLSSLVFGFIR